MVLNGEVKFLIEDYIDSAVKFSDILDFYRSSPKEVKEYMDKLFKERTGKTFSETFILQRKVQRKSRN
ncbi:MAG: hypothetical protein QXG05_08865 [Nitrososphaerota archaeon]